MAIKLGVHTGPQNLSMTDLHRIWKRADEAGFHWISVWDHLRQPAHRALCSCFRRWRRWRLWPR